MKDHLSKLFNIGNDTKDNIKDIDLELIHPNPYQPRKFFEQRQLEELAESIKQYGVMQPVVVRKVGTNYELVAGERRTRASRLAGLKTIPAIVKNLTDKETAEIALIENLQRENLNYFEEAEGYNRLLKEFDLTQEELAKKVSKSQSTVANKIRLLNLDKDVRDLITFDVITERHARALLKLEDQESQKKLLQAIYEKGLNVRQTDELVEVILIDSEKKENEKVKRKVKKVYKDMRIFLNTIRDAVNTIKDAGLEADIKEDENEEYFEVTIKLPKNNTAK
ncbi:ParB family protein [Desulfonispora thiosulfatigenes DSM 11270]|uniref:ParB family protein n=1 Tax=Desulfonispora thiosulfatigenes DSM 11270 TaxID=656914 RepID=A0A1W1V2M9_DESTI|nr:nucleoid occlusion protein [Desulfonispora thiosulfatigenes]SMB87558.1 ParB family protein [Desulfonispora thiosulfatigenes DSM 11270]